MKLSRALTRPPSWGHCPTPHNNRQGHYALPSGSNALRSVGTLSLRECPPTPKQTPNQTPTRSAPSALCRSANARQLQSKLQTKLQRAPLRHFVSWWQFSTSGPSAIHFRWSRSTSIGVWPSLRDRQDYPSAGA